MWVAITSLALLVLIQAGIAAAQRRRHHDLETQVSFWRNLAEERQNTVFELLQKQNHTPNLPLDALKPPPTKPRNGKRRRKALTLHGIPAVKPSEDD